MGGAAVVRAVLTEFYEYGNKYCKRKDYQLKSVLTNARSGSNERMEDIMSKEQYIKKIINLMYRCNDLALLDLILRLLVKSL